MTPTTLEPETTALHRDVRPLLGCLCPHQRRLGAPRTVRLCLCLCLVGLVAGGCSDSDSGTGIFEGDGVDLLDKLHSPGSLAAAGDAIFFADKQEGAGAIAKISLAGGAVTQLAGPTAAPPTELASDGQWVAWIEAEAGQGAVGRVLAAGGEPQEVAGGLQEPVALTINAGNVYYVERAAAVIWLAPEAGGPPVALASDVEAVQSLATDGEHLYFAQAYDAPHGAIRRLRLAENPLEPQAVEELVTGLGAPFELVIASEEICWRELQRGLLQCAPKAGGQPRLLARDQGFIPLARPQLAADESALFFATKDDIRRLSLDGGQIQLVARAGEFSMIRALVVVGGTLYWSDGTHLRSIDKTHVVPIPAGPDGGVPPGPGCPSSYDGTYIGQLVYEYDAGDPANPPLTPVTGSVALTLKLSCVATAGDTTVLKITHAVADDPFFGCQLGGCTPQFASTAALPAEAPTTPSNSSQAGSGLVVLFPNGTSIATTNYAGALTVTTDARTLSNSLDPAIQDSTWVAGSAPSGGTFPPDRKPGAPVTRYKSWKLNKSNL